MSYQLNEANVSLVVRARELQPQIFDLCRKIGWCGRGTNSLAPHTTHLVVVRQQPLNRDPPPKQPDAGASPPLCRERRVFDDLIKANQHGWVGVGGGRVGA